MGDLNARNVTLMALVASCFLQIGAQLFALSVVASTIVAAPPRSFAILQGDHGYDSSGFWETLPPITAVLFIVALIANWRTSRRLLVMAAFALFILGGVLAGLVLEPQFAGLIAGGYRDAVDPALQSRARSWYALDWAVWGVTALAGIALLVALVRSPARNTRAVTE